LPDYVARLGFNFTIQLTPIYSGKKIEQLYASEVENNSFTVYGENTKFYWMVNATRQNIVVEPYKTDVNVNGNGPYKWYTSAKQAQSKWDNPSKDDDCL
jgi:hypothetical protein